MVYLKCVFRCKFNLNCFSIAVTCNIFLLIIWQSFVCVCLFLFPLLFLLPTLLAGSWVFESCIVCLAGWAGCLSFIQFTGFSKIFVRQTTHYVPSNICLLSSLLLSLPCISIYGCTINEYLYRDRCNNRLYLMLLLCLQISIVLFDSFVCFIVLECECVCLSVWWLNLKISIQNIRLYQKETFSLIIILISWSFFIYMYCFFWVWFIFIAKLLKLILFLVCIVKRERKQVYEM